MKKYIVFAVSFVALFFILQISSGYIASLLYTPDFSSAWHQVGNLSETVIIERSSLVHLLAIAFISASIAYFIPKGTVIKNLIK